MAQEVHMTMGGIFQLLPSGFVGKDDILAAYDDKVQAQRVMMFANAKTEQFEEGVFRRLARERKQAEADLAELIRRNAHGTDV